MSTSALAGQVRVLTIGREFGCGSGEIARKIADALGWKLFDRELIDEIARRTHREPDECRRADERADRWLHRIGRGLWNAAGEKGPALIPDEEIGSDAMASLTRRVIEDVAAAGACVIVGRGGNYILHQRPDCFHVFLYAPQSWRIRRLELIGHTHAEAEGLVQRTDQERTAYIRRYFDQDWPRRQLYHVMVNTSLGVERSVASVLAALGHTLGTA